MSYSESKEFIRAKQLVNEGNYDEAIQLMKNFEKMGESSNNDLVLWHLLKCNILCQQHLYKELFELAKQTFNESLGLGRNLLSVDALYYRARALMHSVNLEKAEEIIKQGEKLLKTLTHELPKYYKQREADIEFLKGLFYSPIYAPKGDPDLALEHFEQCLALREECGDKYEVAECLYLMGWTLSFCKGELNQAFEYIERGLTLAKESDRKFTIAWGLYTKAVYYYFKGELDRSIILYEQSLLLFKELNNKYYIANILNTMSEAYRMKGEIERALEYSEKSIAGFIEHGNLKLTAYAYDYLIQILIEKGDLKRAQKGLDQLEQIKDELNDRIINSTYLRNKAILLKTSSRTLNRGEAEKIFRQILEDKKSSYDEIVRALLNLCELLLIELHATSEPEILDELQTYISQLFEAVKTSRSYFLLAETYLIQARLSLITLHMKKARQFLTKGQQIAEKYGLNLLARKISNEHDKLLKQLSMWEKLKESKAPLIERMELARLNEQIENMVRKRALEVPELSDEEPIVLLIISEGGRPVFSESFVKEWSFEDHLFGGFLTAINSFSDEMFSEGLNRANFGEYTIIMNHLPPFLVCYLFKGQSYLAQQRVAKFIDHVKEDEEIWEKFNKFNQACQFVQLKDIPSLEPLINDIFVDKTVPLIV